MKKSIFIIGFAVLLSLGLVSCTKEHAENQRITIHADIQLLHGTTYAHQLGTAWVEPGFTATVDGEDVSSEVVISDNVKPDVSGVYNKTYTYTNKDGFDSIVSRKVVVYDIINASDTDITGTYTTQWSRDEAEGVPAKTWAGIKDKKIEEGPAKGLFYVQDLICGFYTDEKGYAASSAFKTLILLNKDNSISILTDKDPYWGDEIKDNGGSNLNTDTEVVTMNWYWAGWGTNITTTYTPKN